MGEGTTITADMVKGTWVVHARGPLDRTALAQLSFTLSRLVRLGNRDLVVDLRAADGDARDVLGQAARHAEAAGVGFATVEPGEPDESAAMIRAGLASRRHPGRTSLTPAQVVAAAA